MTIGIFRVEGYFDRLTYALETISKHFRSIRHHFASTYTAVVFFQMVKLRTSPLVFINADKTNFTSFTNVKHLLQGHGHNGKSSLNSESLISRHTVHAFSNVLCSADIVPAAICVPAPFPLPMS